MTRRAGMPARSHRFRGLRSVSAEAALASPAHTPRRSASQKGTTVMNRSRSMLSMTEAWRRTAGR